MKNWGIFADRLARSITPRNGDDDYTEHRSSRSYSSVGDIAASCISMFFVFTDCCRFILMGLLTSTAEFVHHGRYPLSGSQVSDVVATKGVIVSEELETSKQGVDLGR
jgi:hypothetical protein